MSILVNYQYFLVEIDKAEQEKKRRNVQSQERSWLGFTGAFIEQPKNPTLSAVHIQTVDPDSPAAAAGLLGGDQLFSVDGIPLKSFEQLVEYVWVKIPGEKIRLSLKSKLNPTVLTEKTLVLGTKSPKLVRSDQYVDMRFNLQWGRIIQIGAKAKEQFPVAEIGDILIFNHKVEYKARETNDETYADYHLVGQAENGNELRIVDYVYEVYGVVKPGQAHIYPYKDVIFCHQQFKNPSILEKDGIYMPDAWEKTVEELTEKIDELKMQIESLAESTVFKADANEENYLIKDQFQRQIDKINGERAAITRQLHQAQLKELTVLFINPRSCEILGHPIAAGDKVLVNYHTLYPLDLGGVYYTLANVKYIDILINQKTLEMRAPYNKLIVRPDEAKKTTDGGIVIPDTAVKRSVTGNVVAVGPGSQEYPQLIKEGMNVKYGEHAGTNFEHNGEKLVLLSTADVLTFDF